MTLFKLKVLIRVLKSKKREAGINFVLLFSVKKHDVIHEILFT